MDAPAVASEPNTKWLKRVLVPFWTIRVILMVLFLVVFGFALWALSRVNDNLDDSDKVQVPASLWAVVAVYIVLIVGCLALDIASMVMLGRHTLKPKTFLIFQCVETTIWTVIFILEIVGAARMTVNGTTVNGSASGWLITLILLVSFVALLIYASVIYHRSRRSSRSRQSISTNDLAGTAYQPVSNPFNNEYAVPSQTSLQAYPAPNHGGGLAAGGLYQPPLASPEIRNERYG